MRCLICRSLELAFQAQRNHFLEASALACNQVTTRLAAYWNVEMERARNDLDDHRATCVFFASSALAPAASQRKFVRQDSPSSNAIAPAA
jgi:hypothetical protein